MGYLVCYLATLLSIVVFDAVWLGFVAKNFYAQQLAHLLAPSPNLAAAGLFYLLYPAGLVIFAAGPAMAAHNIKQAAMMGALFGLFAYATYDLSNYATLKAWPLQVAIVDIAWGMFISAVAASIGAWVADALY
ncbi:MAG: hypothetical protein B7Z78_11445 [Rhodospirillales bacterium 20-60-12]|nr:MAG: hypothetical protein B7Z78_11445 [Rhodospirillales bacterium 20-60-12]HQT68473.1 DUF2177 family protein [Acetobacteraceae bacterium]